MHLYRTTIVLLQLYIQVYAAHAGSGLAPPVRSLPIGPMARAITPPILQPLPLLRASLVDVERDQACRTCRKTLSRKLILARSASKEIFVVSC